MPRLTLWLDCHGYLLLLAVWHPPSIQSLTGSSIPLLKTMITHVLKKWSSHLQGNLSNCLICASGVFTGFRSHEIPLKSHEKFQIHIRDNCLNCPASARIISSIHLKGTPHKHFSQWSCTYHILLWALTTSCFGSIPKAASQTTPSRTSFETIQSITDESHLHALLVNMPWITSHISVLKLDLCGTARLHCSKRKRCKVIPSQCTQQWIWQML